MKKTLFIIFSVIIASAISGCGSNGIVSEENTAVTEVSNTENINDPVATNDIVHADGPTTGTLNGHDWVDLGLPSGTKWATCNVGANSPTAYGNYYAWGETFTKSEYGESNYTYSDNPTILPPSADAATANWGNGWRMPTNTEFDELQKRCSWEWKDGGYKVTGPNGNSIFLPAAGDLDGHAGSYGYYWTSSFELDDDAPWFVIFASDDYDMGLLIDRYSGLSVRPVCN